MSSHRMTTLNHEQRLADFVKEAAAYFEEHDDKATYGGDPTPGEYLALRWGLGRDCVLVVLLDEYFKPVIYQQTHKVPS